MCESAMDRNAIRTPELEVHLLTCKEVEDENDDEDENDLGRKQASRNPVRKWSRVL